MSCTSGADAIRSARVILRRMLSPPPVEQLLEVLLQQLVDVVLGEEVPHIANAGGREKGAAVAVSGQPRMRQDHALGSQVASITLVSTGSRNDWAAFVTSSSVAQASWSSLAIAA
jgi:hypothetical protein